MSKFNSLSRSVPAFGSSVANVRITPHAGFGVFASVDLLPASDLLRSERPVSHVIFRVFRRETCAHCFAYDCGQSWKIKDLHCGVVFCSVACQDAWLAIYPPLARESLAALESFVQLRNRKDNNGRTMIEPIAFGSVDGPGECQIDESWFSVQARADLIRGARISNGTKVTKAHKRALQEAIQLRVDNTDILSFLLSGIISHMTSPALWETLLSVSPEPRPYASENALRQTTNAYLQLLAILPVEILPFVSPAVIHALVARDVRNSFGIWSGTGSLDGDEFLGYGTWPDASFFNHSCAPTVYKGREGQSWVFRSRPGRSIRQNEELCISYLGEEENNLPVAERRRKLKKGWGFDCMCPKCCSEAIVEQ